jgi:hypothetical protein
VAIYDVFDKSPTPAGAHLIAGHVRKDNKDFDASKSYFTNKDGVGIDLMTALFLLVKAKETGTNLTQFKKDESKKVSLPPKEVTRITADDGKLGFAVTWGDQVGIDSNGAVCKWVCLFVTKNLTAGRHQWVTAYPATGDYVAGKMF